jgi:hypothetical protein
MISNKIKKYTSIKHSKNANKFNKVKKTSKKNMKNIKTIKHTTKKSSQRGGGLFGFGNCDNNKKLFGISQCDKKYRELKNAFLDDIKDKTKPEQKRIRNYAETCIEPITCSKYLKTDQMRNTIRVLLELKLLEPIGKTLKPIISHLISSHVISKLPKNKMIKK